MNLNEPWKYNADDPYFKAQAQLAKDKQEYELRLKDMQLADGCEKLAALTRTIQSDGHIEQLITTQGETHLKNLQDALTDMLTKVNQMTKWSEEERSIRQLFLPSGKFICLEPLDTALTARDIDPSDKFTCLEPLDTALTARDIEPGETFLPDSPNKVHAELHNVLRWHAWSSPNDENMNIRNLLDGSLDIFWHRSAAHGLRRILGWQLNTCRTFAPKHHGLLPIHASVEDAKRNVNLPIINLFKPDDTYPLTPPSVEIFTPILTTDTKFKQIGRFSEEMTQALVDIQVAPQDDVMYIEVAEIGTSDRPQYLSMDAHEQSNGSTMTSVPNSGVHLYLIRPPNREIAGIVVKQHATPIDVCNSNTHAVVRRTDLRQVLAVDAPNTTLEQLIMTNNGSTSNNTPGCYRSVTVVQYKQTYEKI